MRVAHLQTGEPYSGPRVSRGACAPVARVRAAEVTCQAPSRPMRRRGPLGSTWNMPERSAFDRRVQIALGFIRREPHAGGKSPNEP